MAAPVVPAVRGLRPRPPSKLRSTLVRLAVLAVFLICLVVVDARWDRLAELPSSLATYVPLMLRGVLQNPFAEENLANWTLSLGFMLESLQMAWIGTLIGASFSLPLGFLAASNVAPRPVVIVTRQILNAIRAIPDLIFAIVIMMPIFGLGPMAGGLAIGVSSIGTLGKLTSEAIEGISPGPVEAVRSSGASPLQVVRWGMLPQALPEIVSFWLYRFEVNIRASAILGVVGAGGVGSLLGQLFRMRDWDRIGVTLVVIIVVTIVVDQISGAVRHRIISGRAPKLGAAIV